MLVLQQMKNELLKLAPGDSVLDVGCGLGDDVFRMAELVMPGGSVIGVDYSAGLIAEAAARSPVGLPVEFRQTDPRHLPFADESFTCCRIDRTLQHSKQPEEIIAEMIRVLKPGGMLLAHDNDWATFKVNGAERTTSGVIEAAWKKSCINPRIGKDLDRFFLDAGLTNVAEYPSQSAVTEFDQADRIFNLRRCVQRAVKDGVLTREAADNWLIELQRQSRVEGFRCSLSSYTVTGIKPVSIAVLQDRQGVA